MARLRERIFLGGFALLFLLTSVGGAGFIIWEMIEDSKSTKQSTAETTATTKNTNASEGKPLEDFTPLAKIDGLQTVDTTVGTGNEVKAGDTVTVHYTGAVAATGKIFQSSLDMGEPVTFGLDQVIAGWKEGIPGMKEGGKRRLLIPADKAYGATPPSGSGIPANADLVFDVTLQKIGQ